MKLMTMTFEIERQAITVTRVPSLHDVRVQAPYRWEAVYTIETLGDARRIAEGILARTYDFNAVIPKEEIIYLADAMMSLRGSE